MKISRWEMTISDFVFIGIEFLCSFVFFRCQVYLRTICEEFLQAPIAAVPRFLLQLKHPFLFACLLNFAFSTCMSAANHCLGIRKCFLLVRTLFSVCLLLALVIVMILPIFSVFPILIDIPQLDFHDLFGFLVCIMIFYVITYRFSRGHNSPE